METSKELQGKCREVQWSGVKFEAVQKGVAEFRDLQLIGDLNESLGEWHEQCVPTNCF